MRALAADAAEDLAHIVQQVAVVDGPAQLDVAEVAWAVDLGAHTGLAEAVFVHRAHEVVVDSVRDWIPTLSVRLLFVYLRHTQPGYVLLREDRERQAVDFVERDVGVLELVLHLPRLFYF